MDLKSIPDGWVSESYEIGDPPLVFRDAIVMEASEYAKLTPEQIQEIKQKRYVQWLLRLEKMKPQPDPPEAPIDLISE
jgi:hypothetical protein